MKLCLGRVLLADEIQLKDSGALVCNCVFQSKANSFHVETASTIFNLIVEKNSCFTTLKKLRTFEFSTDPTKPLNTYNIHLPMAQPTATKLHHSLLPHIHGTCSVLSREGDPLMNLHLKKKTPWLRFSKKNLSLDGVVENHPLFNKKRVEMDSVPK